MRALTPFQGGHTSCMMCPTGFFNTFWHAKMHFTLNESTLKKILFKSPHWLQSCTKNLPNAESIYLYAKQPTHNENLTSLEGLLVYKILGIDTCTRKCQKWTQLGSTNLSIVFLHMKFLFLYSDLKCIVLNQCFNFVDQVKFDPQGHFTHETESPWLVHVKHELV
jgi:hypothetical protein